MVYVACGFIERTRRFAGGAVFFKLFKAFFYVFNCVGGGRVLNSGLLRRPEALPAFKRLLRPNTMVFYTQKATGRSRVHSYYYTERYK
jgi:hypothetical protein